MKQLYGGAHRAEKKDQRRATQRAGARPAETYFGEDFVGEYEYYDDEEAYYDEAYYEDDGDEHVEDEEVPPELDEAYDEVEEAYANWQDSRKKMTELSRARGFYPVVAMLPSGGILPISAQAQRKGAGAGRKGKGKGKGKGKDSPLFAAKGSPVRRPPWQPATASSASPAASPTSGPFSFGPKTTTSGATGQHRPRFKRMWAGGNWKETAEEGNMAEEILSSVFAASGVDQEQALTVETGDGIVD